MIDEYGSAEEREINSIIQDIIILRLRFGYSQFSKEYKGFKINVNITDPIEMIKESMKNVENTENEPHRKATVKPIDLTVDDVHAQNKKLLDKDYAKTNLNATESK